MSFLLTHINRVRAQLANTEEYIDGALAGNLGEVLIRYVGVLDGLFCLGAGASALLTCVSDFCMRNLFLLKSPQHPFTRLQV